MGNSLQKQRIALLSVFPIEDGREGWGRIADLAGVDDLDAKFERVHLLEGGATPEEVEARAFQLTPGLRDRFVLFLGRDAAKPFGVLEGPWFKIIHHVPGVFTCAVSPHPGENTLFWNDLSKVIAARSFFEKLGKGYPFQLKAISWRMAIRMFEKLVEKLILGGEGEAKGGSLCGDSI